VLARNCNNLLFREPGTLHCSPLQQGRTLNPPGKKNSVAGHLYSN
jgi:hypothetical protein